MCCTLIAAVCGTLAVSAKDIQVDVKLGLLMAAFKGPIQSAMETQLDGLIKPAPAAAKSAAAKPAGKAKKIVLALAGWGASANDSARARFQ